MDFRLFKNSINIIIVLIIIIISFCSCNSVTASNSDNDILIAAKFMENTLETDFDMKLKEANEFSLISQNEKFELYINGVTTEIALKDKINNTMWYSNPENRAKDKIALGDNADFLQSQLILHYYNDQNVFTTYDNATDSVENEQYCFSKIDNGIKVSYLIGENKKVFLAPRALTVEKMKTIFSKISEEDKNNLLMYYSLTKLSEIKDEVAKEQLIKSYPMIVNSDLYTLAVTTTGIIPDYILQSIQDVLVKTGYNYDDLKIDYEENKIPYPVDKNPAFYVSIEYTLENDEFVVKIPAKDVFYNKKFILSDIDVLPFFGAADASKTGYIFVPDGSGALIELNNGKLNYDSYSKPLYGRDKSNTVDKLKKIDNTQGYLPIFGLKQNDTSFLAVIEKNDSIASIKADVSGRNTSYNQVYSSFETTVHGIQLFSGMNYAGNSNFQPNPFRDDIQIKYMFLYGESSDYTGMALKYQEYLLKNKLIQKQEFKKDIPFNINLIGGVKYDSTFLGFSVKKFKTLTTYEQAKQLLIRLKNNSVKNINFIYTAWCNEGLTNSSAKKISNISKLGTKLQFQGLNEYTKNNEISFYPDVEFLYVYENSPFNKFNKNKDAAKSLDNVIAYDYDYSVSVFNRIKSTKRTIVSPLSYDKITLDFLKSYKEYAVNALSIASFGKDLNSDFNKQKTVSREKAKQYIIEQMDRIKNSGYKISVSGANVYTLKNASNIVNIPNSSGENYLIDESIPFYQIVLHGILPFASSPLNMSNRYTDDYLKLIETGASPLFQFIYAENSELKETNYNFYAINYSAWLEKSTQLYSKINNVFSDCQSSKIIFHNKVVENVYKTVFENGTIVYVNYNSTPVKADENSIAAKDYKVVKVGETSGK